MRDFQGKSGNHKRKRQIKIRIFIVQITLPTRSPTLHLSCGLCSAQSTKSKPSIEDLVGNIPYQIIHHTCDIFSPQCLDIDEDKDATRPPLGSTCVIFPIFPFFSVLENLTHVNPKAVVCRNPSAIRPRGIIITTRPPVTFRPKSQTTMMKRHALSMMSHAPKSTQWL